MHEPARVVLLQLLHNFTNFPHHVHPSSSNIRMHAESKCCFCKAFRMVERERKSCHRLPTMVMQQMDAATREKNRISALPEITEFKGQRHDMFQFSQE